MWIARPEAIGDPALFDAYRALVTPEERARGERFRFERHRKVFWVTRALVRTTLSRYVDVSPESWRFEPNEHGRPEVVGPCDLEELSFNLSHTGGLIACAVTRGAVVGCDVEDLERRVETTLVAGRFFAPTEARSVRASPESLRLRRFLELWTLKEAYLKARGTGLRLPLRGFAFELARPTPDAAHDLPHGIAISFDGIDDDPARWRFELLEPGPRHILAVAVDSPAPRPVRLLECVPLQDHAPHTG